MEKVSDTFFPLIVESDQLVPRDPKLVSLHHD